MANPNLELKLDYHFTDEVTSLCKVYPPHKKKKTFEVWSKHSEV